MVFQNSKEIANGVCRKLIKLTAANGIVSSLFRKTTNIQINNRDSKYKQIT